MTTQQRGMRINEIQDEIARLQRMRSDLYAQIHLIQEKMEPLFAEHVHLLAQVLSERHDDHEDPACVCGVHRSEHLLCGCGEWERRR